MQFEKDTRAKKLANDAADPFEIDAMIKEVTGGVGGNGSGNKRYGIQEPDDRASKRARVEDDER